MGTMKIQAVLTFEVETPPMVTEAMKNAIVDGVEKGITDLFKTIPNRDGMRYVDANVFKID